MYTQDKFICKKNKKHLHKHVLIGNYYTIEIFAKENITAGKKNDFTIYWQKNIELQGFKLRKNLLSMSFFDFIRLLMHNPYNIFSANRNYDSVNLKEISKAQIPKVLLSNSQNLEEKFTKLEIQIKYNFDFKFTIMPNIVVKVDTDHSFSVGRKDSRNRMKKEIF